MFFFFFYKGASCFTLKMEFPLQLFTFIHIRWLTLEANCCLYYRNDPKFSDRYAWANSADPDQTAPRGV